VLAREGLKLAKLIGEKRVRVRDRSRSMGRKLRAITRTIRRRSGEAKAEVLKLTAETGELLSKSVKEARRLAVVARRKARGRGARAKLKAAAALEEMADRCEKVAGQIRQRVAGEPIKDRIVSLHDPNARPIRKGKLGKPNEFGFVSQLAEVTENTKPGARGVDPAGLDRAGQPGRGHAAAADRGRASAARDQRAGGRPRWWVQRRGPTNAALADLLPKNVFVAGRQEPGSKRTQRRLRRYRTGGGGPYQPPQAPLRAGPLPPERRRGPADLD
jgi:transposase, IS5 family